MKKQEPYLWVKAEEDFPKWIFDQDEYPDNEHSRLRKSIYLVFRNKFHELLTPILEKLHLDVPTIFEVTQEEFVHELPFIETKVCYSRRIEHSWEVWFEDEIQLLYNLQEADPLTIANFYKNQFPKISAMVTQNNGTIDDAKDLFQDGMVILVDKITWGKLEVMKCSAGTYFYSICQNLWYNRLRTMKKEKKFINDSWEDITVVSTEYYDEEPDNYEKVSHVISTLGNPCKELLELFYYKNIPWETIAILKNYASPASARNQKYKCLEKVKKQLSESLER